MRWIKVSVVGSLVVVLLLHAGVAFAKPLSPKQWKKQGNTICKEMGRDLDVIGVEAFGELDDAEHPTDEQLVAYLGEFAPTVRDAIDEVAALDAPRRFRTRVRRLVVAIDEALTFFEADPVTAFESDEDPFAEADALARDLGLTACVDG